MLTENMMQAYVCTICGFLYDEESADVGSDGKLIPFEELDFDWICPTCGNKADLFIPTESQRSPDIPTQEKEGEE